MQTKFRKLSIMLAAASLGLPGAANADDHVIQLDKAKRAELMADYPNPAWGPENWYLDTFIQLEDNLYTYANANNTRTWALVTDEGVIVGDPISAEDASKLRELIRSVTDQPVKYVVYSHNHWDHVEGAAIFKQEGAQIIAHAKCAARFIERPNPEVVMPDITFEGDYAFELGGEKVDLRFYGKNHSGCMVFPLLKGGKYLHLVDVVSPGAIPWGPAPDTDWLGSIASLQQLEMLDFEVVIPGHGAPMAPKSALTERRLYYAALHDAVVEEYKKGLGPDFRDNVRKRMAPFSYLRAFDLQFHANLENMIYYVGIGE